jgi:CDP-diacylglycerol---serine O-phosphatidyltransferase
MKPIRAVAILPTLFTLGNLACGFFAIVVVSRIEKPTMVEGVLEFRAAPRIESARQLISSDNPTHNLMLCGGLIFLAMLFDTFDGQVARMTRVTSDFGAQLDSLCDVVSFGVAPAILLVKMCPQFTSVHREAIWSIAALFAGCAAMRLARFNVEADDEEDDHSMFVGLPTPAAAAVIASFAILAYTLRSEMNHDTYADFDWWLQTLLPPFALVIALLMVSRIPYPHVVTQLLRGQRSFAHLIAVVFALMALLIVRVYAVPIVCVIFVCGPPVRFLWNHFRHRQARKEPIF